MDNNNNIIQKLFWTEMEFPILQAITCIILAIPCENHPGQKWMTGWSTISSNSIEQMRCVTCAFVFYVPPIASHLAMTLNFNQQTEETGDRTIELFSVTFVMSEFSPKWGGAKWLLPLICVTTICKSVSFIWWFQKFSWGCYFHGNFASAKFRWNKTLWKWRNHPAVLWLV